MTGCTTALFYILYNGATSKKPPRSLRKLGSVTRTTFSLRGRVRGEDRREDTILRGCCGRWLKVTRNPLLNLFCGKRACKKSLLARFCLASGRIARIVHSATQELLAAAASKLVLHDGPHQIERTL